MPVRIIDVALRVGIRDLDNLRRQRLARRERADILMQLLGKERTTIVHARPCLNHHPAQPLIGGQDNAVSASEAYQRLLREI
jgi:hypothetical protein